MQVTVSGTICSELKEYTYDPETGVISFREKSFLPKPKWWQFWKRRIDPQERYVTIAPGTQPGENELSGNTEGE